MSIEYRIGCRASTSALKEGILDFRERGSDIRITVGRIWAMHTLSFRSRLSPVTLSNPITRLPGTWGVEAILETKSRAHHIGSTDRSFGCLPMWVPLLPQQSPKLAEALLAQVFFFGMENELVAWMGAYFNLVFGRPQPFPNWSRKLISEVPVD